MTNKEINDWIRQRFDSSHEDKAYINEPEQSENKEVMQ